MEMKGQSGCAAQSLTGTHQANRVVAVAVVVADVAIVEVDVPGVVGEAHIGGRRTITLARRVGKPHGVDGGAGGGNASVHDAIEFVDRGQAPIGEAAQGDAVDWLKTRLDHQKGQLHLIYSTVAWQYFPDDKKPEGAAMIASAGARATAATPLAWFGMENDGDERGAALTLRLWPGDITLDLGRADFHGRWIEWTGP